MKPITMLLLIFGLLSLWIIGDIVQAENDEKIFIVAALPNPSATDSQAEWLGIVNYSGADIFTDSLTVSINGSTAMPISKLNSKLTAGRIRYFIRDVNQWMSSGYELSDLNISLTNKPSQIVLFYNNIAIQTFEYTNISEDEITVFSINCGKYTTTKVSDYAYGYNDCKIEQPVSYPQINIEAVTIPSQGNINLNENTQTTKSAHYQPRATTKLPQTEGKVYEYESVIVRPGKVYLSSLISLSSLVLALIGLYSELPKQLHYYRAQLGVGNH